jgi:hypothetical protein
VKGCPSIIKNPRNIIQKVAQVRDKSCAGFSEELRNLSGELRFFQRGIFQSGNDPVAGAVLDAHFFHVGGGVPLRKTGRYANTNHTKRLSLLPRATPPSTPEKFNPEGTP